MKASRTFLGSPKNFFEFRTRFAVFGLAIAALTLMPFPLNGAQFYTNWAAAHFSANPAQGDPLADPDADGELNVVEFAFGTDPLAGGGIAGAVQLLYGGASGTNSVFQVEILEREGHQPGMQIDLYLSARLTTNWFRPWWLRTTTNSLPGDPPGSVRELFTTRLPGTNVWFVRPRVQLFEGGAETANYYVATNGSDTTNSGTSITAPYATLAKAASSAGAGNLIYVRGGVYPTSTKISLTKINVAGQPIRIRAYPGESPVLDFSGQTGTGSSYDGIAISGNYYWLYGLVFTNAGHSSIAITGTNNIVERCVSLGARNTGFHIGGGSSATSKAATNLYLNCDSIRSYDAPVGGNADGFSAKWSIGTGNVFSGCRSCENSDDGWDLWMGSQPVLITNCWAFRNGSNVWASGPFAGNGNGFKLGGSGVPAAHRLVASLAFHNVGTNGGNGIDQNSNTRGQTVDQNTSWLNRYSNFSLNNGANTTPHVVRNNISFMGGRSDSFTTGTLTNNNSWQVISPTVNTNDFLTVDESFAVAPRRDDGSLPETPFFRPVPGGRLVDKGVNMGMPFYGSAPDLGTFETPTW
jgi:hypothetical protein